MKEPSSLIKTVLAGDNISAICLQLAETIDFSTKNLIITPSQAITQTLLQDLRFFGHKSVPTSSNKELLSELPELELLPYEAINTASELSGRRTLSLCSFLKQNCTVICSVKALGQKQLPADHFNSTALKIRPDAIIDKDELIQKLNELGYKQVSLVEQKTEFALHGQTIDLFPINSIEAVRIQFTSNSISDLRFFNINTQRSIKKADQIEVFSLRTVPNYSTELAAQLKQNLLNLDIDDDSRQDFLRKLRVSNFNFPELTNLLPCLNLPLKNILSQAKEKKQKVNIFIINPEQCNSNYQKHFKAVKKRYEQLKSKNTIFPPEEYWKTPEELVETITKANEKDQLAESNGLIDNKDLKQVSMLEYAPGKSPIKTALQSFVADGYKILIAIRTPLRIKRLQNILKSEADQKPLSLKTIEPELNKSKYQSWLILKNKPDISIIQGEFSSGFRVPGKRRMLISEEDIFPAKSVRSRDNKNNINLKRILSSLSLLNDGDYIIHEDYGRGIYHGLKPMQISGQHGEFLHLEYADSMLYLPVNRIGRIQKYQSAAGKPKELDRLGSKKWSRIKEKVSKSVNLLAGDLINLYATRDNLKAEKYEPANYLDQEFADYFLYDETPDQLKAIEETLSNLASGKLMDRLICGDVGFGKTEVAMRATFKVAMAGKQVAILAPTTLLVDQHYKNFKERFKHFPIQISAVSRFYNRKENELAFKNLASGKTDVIIGTHKILQKDIKFKDLGLLIIDEEQRFGVKQKEKLKQFKNNIHVLTLSATPIPRTLYMSLISIRDISIISTPPTNRKSIKTYINNYSEQLVVDAIDKEVSRGGQVFYVHNRVRDINLVTQKLQELVPNTTFLSAHGQMDEGALEDVMKKFFNQEADVLVTTSIIENGIDLENVNTLIVDRADRFGLAGLYQLRGRVGRSNRQAYAYLLVPEIKKVTPEAMERLKALERIDDLGQGFQLAMRDLEIRGTGNILGKEQSGNINLIGYELYTRLIRDAIANLKGKQVETFIEPEIKIPVAAYIPETFIMNPGERLLLYQRFANVKDESELNKLILEIGDRFGSLPPETINYSIVMSIRLKLKAFGVNELIVSSSTIKIKPAETNLFNTQKTINLCHKDPKTFNISPKGIITIHYNLESNQLDLLKNFIAECLTNIC